MPRSPLLDLAAAVYIADTVSRWDIRRVVRAAGWTLVAILTAFAALFLIGAVVEQDGALLVCALILGAPGAAVWWWQRPVKPSVPPTSIAKTRNPP